MSALYDPDGPPVTLCRDCGTDTFVALGEYSYMVTSPVWKAACPEENGDGTLFLCVACLERRLGRELTAEDFKSDVPLNFYPWSDSPLLADRKTGLVATGAAAAAT